MQRLSHLPRKLLRAKPVHRFLCRIVAAYIHLVWRTSRWRTEGAEAPKAHWQEKRPFILAFWHGRLLMMPMAWPRDAPMNMLISGHRDGRIIADAIHYFGLRTITGSRSKGGSAALRAMLRTLREGANVGVTPDGPRGPRMRATGGIIAAARLSGAPIIPLAYATTHRTILGSWDRFHLALPFSRGLFLWGAPLFVPPKAEDEELEALRLQLETTMNDLTAEADRRCRHKPVLPASIPAGGIVS